MDTRSNPSPIRPLIAYFLLTYSITWGLLLAFLTSKGFRFEDISLNDGFVMFLCMLAGPSISGLLLTWRLEGRAGLSRMAERARRWRVQPAWLAVALGTNPVVYLVILLTLTVLRFGRLRAGLPTDRVGHRPDGRLHRGTGVDGLRDAAPPVPRVSATSRHRAWPDLGHLARARRLRGQQR